jgi:hypothetical protein
MNASPGVGQLKRIPTANRVTRHDRVLHTNMSRDSRCGCDSCADAAAVGLTLELHTHNTQLLHHERVSGVQCGGVFRNSCSTCSAWSIHSCILGCLLNSDPSTATVFPHLDIIVTRQSCACGVRGAAPRAPADHRSDACSCESCSASRDTLADHAQSIDVVLGDDGVACCDTFYDLSNLEEDVLR